MGGDCEVLRRLPSDRTAAERLRVESFQRAVVKETALRETADSGE